VTGQEKAEKAFMGGKIKATNMADLMRYATAFDMSKGAKEAQARLAAASAPAPAAAPAAPAAPAPAKSPIGRKYRVPHEFADPKHISAYAAATGDTNPAYAAGKGQIAPPLFTVRALHPLAMGAIVDPSLGLDLLRLVHGEQEMHFHQPIAAWDILTPRGELLDIEEKPSGKVVQFGQKIFVDGNVAVTAVSSYFIRGGKSGGGGSAEAAPEADPGTPSFEAVETLKPGQTVDYAAASRDDNPIHVNEDIARAAGFPTVIGHGLLTMAFVQRGIIEKAGGGDPRRLKRLKVRFSKPVLPGDVLTTRGWLTADQGGVKTYRIVTTNQRGEKVISNAEADVA
jgi:acyl dehydratase